MMYTLDLENLNEEQLNAFKVIDEEAYTAECKRREESTYTDADMKAGKVYADLYKAYFYLKPMYDNMRNTDVKKSITQSNILPVIEKVIKWVDKNEVKYEKFKGEPLVANISVPIDVEVKVNEPVVTVAETPKVEEVTTPVVETPTPTVPEIAPVAYASGDVTEPVTESVTETVEPTPQPTPQPTPEPEPALSPIEAMTQEKLNEILATIPAVEKI